MSVKSLLVAGLVGAFTRLRYRGRAKLADAPPSRGIRRPAARPTSSRGRWRRTLRSALASLSSWTIAPVPAAGRSAAAAAEIACGCRMMFLATTAHTIAPGITGTVLLARDFDPITDVGEVPNVLIVNPKVSTTATGNSPISGQILGKVNYGSAGQRRAPVRRAVPVSRGCSQHRPRPLQGRRADDDRPDRRPYPTAEQPSGSALQHIKAGAVRAFSPSAPRSGRRFSRGCRDSV